MEVNPEIFKHTQQWHKSTLTLCFYSHFPQLCSCMFGFCTPNVLGMAKT